MKIPLSASLQILLIWGIAGCTNAIFAAPVGKDFMERHHAYRSTVLQFFLKSKKNSKSDGYLAAHGIPQLIVSSLRSSPIPIHGTGNSNLAFFGETEKPTLKGFLTHLKSEKQLSEVQGSSSPDNETSVTLSEGQMPEHNTLLPDEDYLNELPLAAESTLPPDLTSEVVGTSSSADFPIFPRPFSRNLFEENLFIYFPLGEINAGGSPLLIVNPEAVFQPPEGNGFKSSATFNLEP